LGRSDNKIEILAGSINFIAPAPAVKAANCGIFIPSVHAACAQVSPELRLSFQLIATHTVQITEHFGHAGGWGA